MTLSRKSWLLLGWLCFGLAACGMDLVHLSGGSRAAVLCLHAGHVKLVSLRRKALPPKTQPAELREVLEPVFARIPWAGFQGGSPEWRSVREQLATRNVEHLNDLAERLNTRAAHETPEAAEANSFDGLWDGTCEAPSMCIRSCSLVEWIPEWPPTIPGPGIRGDTGALRNLVANVERLREWVQDGEADRPNLEPLRNLLEYLAFFFDGDGCVTHHGGSRANMELAVAQSSQCTEILVLFGFCLGGVFSLQRSRTGTTWAALSWRRGREDQQPGELTDHCLAITGQTLVFQARGLLAQTSGKDKHSLPQ